MSKRDIIIIAICALGMSSAYAQSIEDEIRTLMARQQDCWNAGDIDCFMRDYWNSEELVFIGGKGLTYGWQTTLDNYKERYPDRVTMGTLTFDLKSIDVLTNETCYVIGKWSLKREIGDAGGHFTLLWKKIDGKWVIVADHTS